MIQRRMAGWSAMVSSLQQANETGGLSAVCTLVKSTGSMMVCLSALCCALATVLHRIGDDVCRMTILVAPPLLESTSRCHAASRLLVEKA